MRDALAKFHDDAEKIVESFRNTLPQEPPSLIYHYTNDFGLRGVLQTGKVWLTDIFALNDPSELSHGFSLALNGLNNKASSGPPEGKKFAADLAAFTRHGGVQKSGHYFMCSFSSCGDDLGQWRAYADNGRGYAFAFDGKALDEAFGKQAGPPILKAFPIAYNDVQLIEIHRQIVDAMFDLISLPRGKSLQPAAIKAFQAELSTLFMVHAMHAGLHFKHMAYRNEKEYRFLQVYPADAQPDVQRRARDYSLIRYREFDWKTATPEALKKIVIGPAANQEKSSQFAQDCMRLSDTAPVEITCSRIPYRG